MNGFVDRVWEARRRRLKELTVNHDLPAIRTISTARLVDRLVALSNFLDRYGEDDRDVAREYANIQRELRRRAKET